MYIAAIKNNIVENIVAYEENNLQSSIDHLQSKGYTCVVTDIGKIGDTYDSQQQIFISPSEPESVPQPQIPDPTEWLIDIGPFFDRFGAKKLPILMSDDSMVKAIIEDVQVRKWIDLQRQDVSDALTVLVSKNLITTNEKTTILTTPVELREKLALVKSYFS